MRTGKFANGFDWQNNIIWGEKDNSGFFYYTDALLMGLSAKCETIRCMIVSITYPSEKTVIIKKFR